MPKNTIFMILILLLGLFSKSNIIAAAAGILLVLQCTNLQALYPFIENKFLEIGLVFLILSVLVPFASGRVPPGEVLKSCLTLPGIVAIVSGVLATNLNGHGLNLLQREPSLMVGMVAGSIIGVIFFGGIPVGPLMAGGIAAVLMYLVSLVH
jgi:uncharacterized membrane protein (DUF441 family)